MKNDACYIRGYEDGDEKKILALFGYVFRQNMSSETWKKEELENWKWMYAQNPYGRIYASLAFSKENDELIAHYAAIPVPINYRGNKISGCQSVNTMVHPEFRKYGLFMKTADYCYKDLLDDGFAIIYGFPNHRSYPGLIRRLNWHRVAYQTRYRHRLGIYSERIMCSTILGSIANHIMKLFLLTKFSCQIQKLKKNLGQIELNLSKKVPEGYEKLWQSVSSYEVLSIWKDSEYFKWRYDNSPKSNFSYAYLTSGSDLIALGVYDESSMVLCELIAKHRNVSLGKLLVYELCRYYARERQKDIDFIGSDPGFFGEVFSSFECSKMFNRVLCVKSLHNKNLDGIIEHPHNWTTTHGDTNLI